MVTFVENQRAAIEQLKKLSAIPEQVVIIHYSCESFYDTEGGRTPRITSIACRNYGTAQTRSFSIHQYSELPRFKDVDAWEQYDEIEKALLDDYFQFVREHVAHARWVHWNMRDLNYGFPAIEHRYEVLGGVQTKIPDDKKFDLARLLVARYGKRYSGHPRMESIMKINKITDKDFLSGKDEAYAFKDRKFLNLHQSTLRKVDVISSLLEAAATNRLKTRATFWDRNGGSLRLIWEKYVWTPAGRALGGVLLILTLIEWVYPDAKHFVAQRFWGFVGKIKDWYTAAPPPPPTP